MAYTQTQVTVFGGTGFIGRALVDKLADLGVTVRVATRHPQSAYALRTAGVVGQIVPVYCNINDEKSVTSAVAGSDWVVNLVGILAEKGQRSFHRVHHVFPEVLAKIAAENDIKRLVHISALSTDDHGPSAYARSKAAGEKSITTFYPRATILRPSIVFGPEDNFFNLFAKMSQILPFLPLISGGKTLFQPVYVGDVADAITVSLTKSSNVEGKIFELGGEQRYSFRELLEKIGTITKLRKPLIKVPTFVAKMKGAVMQNLPGQILTVDQVRSLSVDNVVSGAYPGLKDLGITPTPLDFILPTYLSRYISGGRFASRHTA